MKLLTLSLISLVALAACGPTVPESTISQPKEVQPPMKATEKPRLLGGLQPIEATDPGALEAAQFAAEKLEGTVQKILNTRRQVVAGLNYHMTLLLDNGIKYDVVVYKDLQGKMSLSSSQVVS